MEFHFYQCFEVLALLASIVCFSGLRRYSISWFVVLLIIDNAFEIAGENFKRFGFSTSYPIYNFYFVTGAPVTFLLFRKMLASRGLARHIFDSMAGLAVVFIILNLAFLQGLARFNSYSTIVFMFLNIAFSCLILFRIARAEVEVPLYRHPYYWINAGILLFSIVTLVALGLQQFIQDNKVILWGKSIYHLILPMANVLLYIGYSIGFYLCKR